MKLLEGKTALITGAARGIGKALAVKFAQEGANIAFTDLVIDENGKESIILSAEDDANKSIHWQFELSNKTKSFKCRTPTISSREFWYTGILEY